MRRINYLVTGLLMMSSSAVAQEALGRPRKVDVVLEWNAIVMNAVASQNGVEQVRLAAIAHLAMFEAVNAIAGHFEPYLGTIVAPTGASAEAAAAVAAHAVLVNYLPDQASSLDGFREISLARVPEGPEKTSGITVGKEAAAALIRHRENDGSQPLESYLPQSTDPGHWQLTPTCPPEGGVFFNWGRVKPFGIIRGDQFRAEAPPLLHSPSFAQDYNEVKTVGGQDSPARPPDRALVARFFTVLSQTLWNPVARQIAAAERSSLAANARAFALLNMAMNDAIIAVLDSKYHYAFWRPETAIRAGETDGNPATEPDAAFQPFVPTPCHPGYPSAHASSSNAARAVLEELFGDGHHVVTLTSAAVPGVEIRYSRLKQITQDIDDARVYGGIHFRFDQQAGSQQGRQVGRYVVAHNLGPVRRRDR